MVDLSSFTRVSTSANAKVSHTYIRLIDGAPKIYFSAAVTKELRNFGWERANTYANSDLTQVVVTRGDDARIGSVGSTDKAMLRISGAKSIWEEKMRGVDRAIYSHRWEKTQDGATALVLELRDKHFGDSVVRRKVANA